MSGKLRLTITHFIYYHTKNLKGFSYQYWVAIKKIGGFSPEQTSGLGFFGYLIFRDFFRTIPWKQRPNITLVWIYRNKETLAYYKVFFSCD